MKLFGSTTRRGHEMGRFTLYLQWSIYFVNTGLK